MVRTWVGKIRSVIAPTKRVACLGTRSATPIVARGHEPHRKAEYMTAPVQPPSPSRNPLRNGGRPYMTAKIDGAVAKRLTNSRRYKRPTKASIFRNFRL